MDLGLDGRRVLVTGASGGLGAAIAAAFVAEGARVLAAGRDPGHPVPDGVAAQVRLDLTAPDAARTLVDTAVRELGGLDTVVAAAGGAVRGRFDDLDDGVWDAGLELNLRSTVRLMRAALPLLRGSTAGRVVLLSALSASEPRAGHVVSNVGKAGVTALAKTLSREWAPDGILVNAVAPGRVRSRQLDRAFPDDEARAAFASQHIPLGRFGAAEEVAPIALLLGSPRNTYVTGQTVGVDGGMAASV
ncbi:SDR family NAD(P)-dependent oxidoreductase [Geodermatophilus sp. DSM 45219]|uniref:SDR family NAD(P)-dependent oxidoreductase n=1 Tax=Geodermatophilus sp. DSM 45219 TaxID=1881103 RepID=UPI0008920B79|nr:SDR family oxidoreductase [Geodermatophilus sp. DSM 45219]SDN56245.1 3-oxoacyl-[acyl-carrier protein] reductase [Geodermatophilus sp. DSM 45219]